MSVVQSITATILVVGVVFSAPVSWGCDSTADPSCTLTSCPMATASEPSCHTKDAAPTENGEGEAHGALSSCDRLDVRLLSCCTAPNDEQEALLGKGAAAATVSPPEADVFAAAEMRPPRHLRHPPVDPAAARLHDLGRFTLHSSLLL